jgi:vacuolar-type H+-ATPase subunit E/Vma4
VALTELTDAVLRQARQEADRTLADGRRECEARWERESARLRQAHAQRLDAMQAEMERAFDRETSSRRTEARLELLKVKNDILEEVFRRAFEGVLSLPGGGYERWLRGRLQAAPDVPGAVVSANERDHGRLARLLTEVKGGAARLDPRPVAIRGGFILRGERADLDFSVEARMGEVRERLAQTLAAEMFKESF